MGLTGVFKKKSKNTIGSFYRKKKERSIFIVIGSVSIFIVANKKTHSIKLNKNFYANLSYYLFTIQDKVNRTLPFIIIGIIAAMSGTLGFLLPETKGRPTKETLSDVVVQNDKKKGLEIYELNEEA